MTESAHVEIVVAGELGDAAEMSASRDCLPGFTGVSILDLEQLNHQNRSRILNQNW